MDERRILDQAPLPVARGFRRYRNATETRERHDAAYYLFEIYLKSVASIAIARYLAGEARDHRVNAVLKGLARPSLGEWLRFLRESVRFLAAGELRDPAVGAIASLLESRETHWPAALDLFNAMRSLRTEATSGKERVRLDVLLGEVVAYRNRVLGHGAHLGSEHYKRFTDLFAAAFGDVLEQSPFLTAGRLVSFDSIHIEAGTRVECGFIEYMGQTPVRVTTPYTIDYGRPVPEKERLHLLDASGELLTLDPLLVVHNEDIYFLNEAKGTPEYLSYSTGERYRPSALGESQKDLFERILGYAVDEARLSQIGEEVAAMAEATTSVPTPKDGGDSERQLGDYRVIREIGRGGMGMVYEAVQESLGRRVALKVLPGSFALDPKRIERFRREARATARIHHPNIVPVYEIGEESGNHFYAMEYLDGRPLDQILAEAQEQQERKRKGDGGTRVSTPSTSEYIAGVVTEFAALAEGLEKAHGLGLVHRDIKPSNIIVAQSGRYVLVDFGLVHDETAHTLTRSGEMVGTLAYMSPEQVSRRRVDARSDVYSLGATLYELLALEPPFEGDDERALQEAILFEEPVSPRLLNPRVNRDLEAIVYRTLEKKPERRYASAGELAADLRRFLAYEPVTASPPSRLRSVVRRVWRQRVKLTAALALAAAAILALVLWIDRHRTTITMTDFERVTTDVGLTTEPSLSVDGSLVVYASDRATGKDLDIWVQPLAGGEPRRVTSHPLDDREPVLSRSAEHVAFRSERNGGGIWVTRLEDETSARLVAPRGRRPRYSPSGELIAYWTGPVQYQSLLHGEVFVVSASGGPPRRLATGFQVARYPIWAPDGESLLFVGKTEDTPTNLPGRAFDLFLVNAAGGPVTRTGVYASLEGAGAQNISYVMPGTWIERQSLFVCAAETSTGSNLWAVELDPETAVVRGRARLLRRGTQLEMNPWVAADGTMVFSGAVKSVELWAVPLDPETGLPRTQIEEPVQLTWSAHFEQHPSISGDGTKVVYGTGIDDGKSDIWLLQIQSGESRLSRLTALAGEEFYAEISDQGSNVILRSHSPDGGKRSLIARVADGRQSPVADSVHPWDWSSDGTRVLTWPLNSGPRASLAVLNVASDTIVPVIRSEKWAVYQGNFSPDDKWICFNGVPDIGDSCVFVAPYEEGRVIPESEWIQITEDTSLADKPRWSFDGNLVYHVSDRDGFRCLYAQRLDAESREPIGDPIGIAHFHSARRSLSNLGIGNLEISAAQDKIVYNMAEITGNIWWARIGERGDGAAD